MKKAIIYFLLVTISATAMAQTPKQKTTSIPIPPPPSKSFVVSSATAKNLPEGATFTNNKVTLKPGYKFETIPNGGGVRLVDVRNSQKPIVINGSFSCSCKGGDTPCNLSTVGGALLCGDDASSCCLISVTVDPPKIAGSAASTSTHQ